MFCLLHWFIFFSPIKSEFKQQLQTVSGELSRDPATEPPDKALKTCTSKALNKTKQSLHKHNARNNIQQNKSPGSRLGGSTCSALWMCSNE